MIWPLVYYSIGILVYMILFAYEKNRTKKHVANSDFLKNLEGINTKNIHLLHKRSFEQVKKEILFYCYFNRIHVSFGIDLSASNQWHGRISFQGQSLHKTHANKIHNPYQKVISQLGIVFEEIFTTKLQYSSFTFGDMTTKDYTYLPLVGTQGGFRNHHEILTAYLEKVKDVTLGGPTSFIPIIKQLLIYGIHCPNDFNILIILTDELKLSHQDPAFVEVFRLLANLPNVCLIIIGVGDGPWQNMSYEEHHLRELLFRKINPKTTTRLGMSIEPSTVCFDNFHLVNFNAFPSKSEKGDPENYFIRAVLQKLPTQLKQAFRNHEKF